MNRRWPCLLVSSPYISLPPYGIIHMEQTLRRINMSNPYLDELMKLLNVTYDDMGGTISFTGKNTYLPSPHYIGEACSIAAAAQGATVAAIHKERNGQGQDISVNMADAIHAMHSIDYIKQNGTPVRLQVIREDITQFYQTKNDRWIFYTGAFPELRDGILNVLQCPNTREGIAHATAQWDPFELEDVLAEKNLIAGIVRTAEEWAAHPQGKALLAEPLIGIDLIQQSEPMPLSPGNRPLSGVKVLDISTGIAGPAIAKTLAEQGAEVLRIQSSTRFDHLAMIMDTDWGKKSAYLNLSDQQDLAKLQLLMKEADIVIDALRPGLLAGKGITPESVAALKPGVIYVSMSGYGFTGPWASRGAFDQQTQCVSGVAMEEGSSDKPKLTPVYYLANRITPYFGAAGALSALLSRIRIGGSYHVKVSMTRCSMWVQAMGTMKKEECEKFKLSDIPAPRLFKLPGPFGDLETLAPVAVFSKTPAFWESAPQPWGASYPVWG